MIRRDCVWLIERFNLRTGNSDGVYVAGLLGGARYYSTTGSVHGATQFRWRWMARLWMWAHRQPFPEEVNLYHEWRATQHGFIWKA